MTADVVGVRRVLVAAGAAVLFGTGAVGCTAASSDGGSASCVLVVTYEGRTYQDVGAYDVSMEATELGKATHPPCNDTGGEEDDGESWESTAYAVEGVDPSVAIAVGGSPDDAVLVAVDVGEDLPAEVRRLMDGS